MSRARWDDTITWMVEHQNMPELERAERKVLLDYLASRFAATAKARRVAEPVAPWGRRCP